jgi:hypothetical protein
LGAGNHPGSGLRSEVANVDLLVERERVVERTLPACPLVGPRADLVPLDDRGLDDGGDLLGVLRLEARVSAAFCFGPTRFIRA